MLKERITQAMRSGKTIERDVLRVVLAEVERSGGAVEKVAAKIIEANTESLSFRHDDKLVEENKVLESLIPKQSSEEEIMTILSSLEELKTLPEGKAMGLAMKVVKNSGLVASGDRIKGFLAKIRS